MNKRLFSIIAVIAAVTTHSVQAYKIEIRNEMKGRNAIVDVYLISAVCSNETGHWLAPKDQEVNGNATWSKQIAGCCLDRVELRVVRGQKEGSIQRKSNGEPELDKVDVFDPAQNFSQKLGCGDWTLLIREDERGNPRLLKW